MFAGMSLGRPHPAFAAAEDGVATCAVGVRGAGPFAPGETSRRLERAWNTSNAQTLALFADDVHILAAWGESWEGRSQLSSFLESFFDHQTRPLQTLAQCENGDEVFWTFRYPSGVNSAMFTTVRNAKVVNLYWQLLPYDFGMTQSRALDAESGSEALVSLPIRDGDQLPCHPPASAHRVFLVLNSYSVQRWLPANPQSR
jgi:hypothetical protein